MSINWEKFGIEAGSEVDDQIVSSIQKNLGVVFPDSYVDLVKFSNCASPEISTFKYQNDETCISDFFEFSEQIKPNTISWYVRPGGFPFLSSGYIPIARDAGDFLICLNFNKTPASVEIIDPTTHKSSLIADSFDQFVSLWHE
jgi:SMI1-KNR4 cell-wall